MGSTSRTKITVEAETIGERIKRERLAHSLTQRVLADQVGVGISHISKVEAGRDNPSDQLLERLGASLNVDPDELLIVARRLPAELAEEMAWHPAQWLDLLRKRVRLGGRGGPL
jgi:transcriptional regulator with XRE-family HTH domain